MSTLELQTSKKKKNQHLGGEKFPEDNLDDISVTVPDTTPSSGEKLPEDKSGTKSTSEGTIPYLGTKVHPIESFSSGSPPSDGHTTQVISGGTTEVISVTDSSTTTDEEYTYVPVTSTPVKKMHQHFLTKMELGTLQICHQQYLGPQKPHQTTCQVMGVIPVQIFQNLNWTTFLDKNLEAIKSHNHSSQNIYKNRKRQFFDSMLKGKDYLHYLLHYLTQ